MSDLLDHSPADILRKLFIIKGYGGDPATSPLPGWPVYASGEPSEPDAAITIYDTTGRVLGRDFTGWNTTHHGIQIRIRASAHTSGYLKANAIAVAMDRGFFQANVTIGSANYKVETFTRTSDILPLGKESAPSKRRIFTINGTLVLRKL